MKNNVTPVGFEPTNMRVKVSELEPLADGVVYIYSDLL